MKENKLKVRWSKRERGIEGIHPLGVNTVCDVDFLFYACFNEQFKKEMEERGYDIKSMKFEITVAPTKRPDRFPTLLKAMQEDKQA